jgi:hypothetical protein
MPAFCLTADLDLRNISGCIGSVTARQAAVTLPRGPGARRWPSRSCRWLGLHWWLVFNAKRPLRRLPSATGLVSALISRSWRTVVASDTHVSDGPRLGIEHPPIHSAAMERVIGAVPQLGLYVQSLALGSGVLPG